MALPSYSKSVGTIFTIAALEALSTDPKDQFHVRCPALEELRKNKVSKKGGQTLTVNVMNGAEPIGGSYTRTGTLNLQDSETLTQAQYGWSFYYEPVVVYHQDFWTCGGDSGMLLNLVKEKTRAAKMKLQRKIAQAVYGSSQTAGVDLLGLPYAITTTPASDGAWGNLDGASTSQSWWRNYSATGGSVSTGACTDALTTMLRQLTDQSVAGKPTIATTDQTTWGYLEKYARSFTQLTIGATNAQGQHYADLGYDVLTHMGVPIISDPFATSGVIYTWHRDALQLVEMSDCAFVMHPDGFVSDLPNRQAAWASIMIWNGQMAGYERRATGKLTSVTS